MGNVKVYEPTFEKAGYRGLVNAIILKAVEDYQKALVRLQKNEKDVFAEAELQNVRKFFFSSWYRNMCGIDPEYLLNRLEKHTLKNGYKSKGIKKNRK